MKFLLNKNAGAAREVIKKFMFDEGRSGWKLQGERYHRSLSMVNHDLTKVISHFSTQTPILFESLGVAATDIQIEKGTRTTLEVSLAKGAFEQQIAPKLN